MPYTVVFLWISATGELASASAHIADYGARRGLTFSQLHASSAAPGLTAYDAPLVDRLEAELEQARTAISALEEDAAAERLQRLQAEISAHPHLPQASFLLAECLALRSQLLRGADALAAEALSRARAGLEGPRAPAFDEPGPTPAAPAATSVKIVGLAPLDELEVDGRVIASRKTELALGLHHVRVWRAGRPIFAAFLPLEQGRAEFVVPAPALLPCSADDLGLRETGHAVACQSWALIRAEGRGIGVSLCRGRDCGAFTHWERRSTPPFTPIVAERTRFPAWATVAIAGMASVAATSLLLWQAGAFEQDSSSAASFRYDGVNPSGSRR